jgi:mitochondrial Rho GTPase 1
MFVLSFLENLCLIWIFEIHEQVKVPVIVVGCKLDLQDEYQYVRVEQMMSPLKQKFCEIESYIECSAYRNTEVSFIYTTAIKFIIFSKSYFKSALIISGFCSIQYTCVIKFPC